MDAHGRSRANSHSPSVADRDDPQGQTLDRERASAIVAAARERTAERLRETAAHSSAVNEQEFYLQRVRSEQRMAQLRQSIHEFVAAEGPDAEVPADWLEELAGLERLMRDQLGWETDSLRHVRRLRSRAERLDSGSPLRSVSQRAMARPLRRLDRRLGCGGRPRAQATRSSVRSGDSSEDPEPPSRWLDAENHRVVLLAGVRP